MQKTVSRTIDPRAFDLLVGEGFFRREYHGLTLVLIFPMVLDVAEDLHETGAFDLDLEWTVVACAGVVFYVTVRLLAKRTRLLRSHPS